MPRSDHALFVLQQIVKSKLRIESDEVNTKKGGILFLTRKNIAGRSDRWSNSDSCYEVIQAQVKRKVMKINPSDHYPSEIAKLVRNASLTLTAAGSAAYNSLLFGESDHKTILVIPYSVNNSLIWKLTLRMFIPFSNRLILVSSDNAPDPTPEGWDSNISLDPNDLANAILKLLNYSPPACRNYPDVSKRKICSFSSLILNLPA